MFARKKPLNPVNRQTICRPWCSSGIWGDLGVKSNPNYFFFIIAAGEIQPFQWWVALHEDEEMGIWPWNRQIHSGQFVLTDGQVLALQIGKVSWGFCPDVEKAKCFKLLFILTEENNSLWVQPWKQSLDPDRELGCSCHANPQPWSSWHISGTGWGAWKIPLALS